MAGEDYSFGTAAPETPAVSLPPPDSLRGENWQFGSATQAPSSAPADVSYASPMKGAGSLDHLVHAASLVGYPATWALTQLGNRVDAAEAAAARPFVEKDWGAFMPGQGGFLGMPKISEDVLKGYVFGTPPKGLPQGQASYSIAREAGANKPLSAGLAMAGSIPAAGPLNLVGGEAAPVIAKGANLGYDALAFGGNLPEGSALARAQSVIPNVAKLVSRTAGMPYAQRLAVSKALEEARQAGNPIAFSAGDLASRLEDYARTAGPNALTRISTAAEDLPRYGQSALAGLNPQEVQLVQDLRAHSDMIPQARALPGLRPNELHGHILTAADQAQVAVKAAQEAQAALEARGVVRTPPPSLPGQAPIPSRLLGIPPLGEAPMTQAGNVGFPGEPHSVTFGKPYANADLPTTGEVNPLMRFYNEQTQAGRQAAEADATKQATIASLKANATARGAINAYNTAAKANPGDVLYADPGDFDQSLQRLGTVGNELPGHIPRLATQELLGKLPEADAGTQFLPKGIATRVGKQRTGSPLETTAEKGARLESSLGLQGPAYEPLPKAVAFRGAQQAEQVKNASLIQALTKDAVPLDEAGPGHVSIKSLGITSGFSEPEQARLEGLAVPKATGEYMKDFDTLLKPGNESNILKSIQGMNTALKPFLTTANPGFIAKFVGWHALKLAADIKDPVVITKAIQATAKAFAGTDLEAPLTIAGMPEVKTVGDWRANLIRSGELNTHASTDFSEAAGTSGGKIRNALKPANLPVIKQVGNMNSNIYNFTRGVYTTARAMQGMDLTAAGMASKNALVDYSPDAFTRAENMFRQNAGLFYAFPRKVTPELVKMGFRDPGTIGALQSVPSNMAAQAGLTNADVQSRLGPKATNMGFIPTKADSGKVTGFYPTASPGNLVNEYLGQRDRGGMGIPDALASLVSAPLPGAAISLAPRNFLLGKNDTGAPTEAPSWARILDGKFGIHVDPVSGRLTAPDNVVRWLYKMPPLANNVTDLVRMIAQGPQGAVAGKQLAKRMPIQQTVSMDANDEANRLHELFAKADSLKYLAHRNLQEQRFQKEMAP